jgi:excisionase family DNA binding protein
MLKSPKASSYLTIPQLAKILGISRIAVYKKVKKGIIPGKKIGRNFVVSATHLRAEISSKNYSSTTQLAQDLNVHRTTIYRRAKKGIIPGIKVGRGFAHTKRYTKDVKADEREDAGFISVPELAKRMGMSRIAVYKKVKKGIIAAVKRGKGFVIRKREALRAEKQLTRITRRRN